MKNQVRLTTFLAILVVATTRPANEYPQKQQKRQEKEGLSNYSTSKYSAQGEENKYGFPGNSLYQAEDDKFSSFVQSQQHDIGDGQGRAKGHSQKENPQSQQRYQDVYGIKPQTFTVENAVQTEKSVPFDNGETSHMKPYHLVKVPYKVEHKVPFPVQKPEPYPVEVPFIVEKEVPFIVKEHHHHHHHQERKPEYFKTKFTVYHHDD